MKIVNRKISELKPAAYNPRRLSEKQFQDLKDSFKKLDVLEPAVINMYKGRENVIISGHQRIKVAKALKMKTYPCVEVKFSEGKEKEANIRMNKNTGDWDFNLLDDMFKLDDLLDWGFKDFELLGFKTDNANDANKEWKGMPEFDQDDLMPCRRLIVNFLSEDDAQAFAKIMKQKLTDKTRMLYFPAQPRGKFSDKEWIADAE